MYPLLSNHHLSYREVPIIFYPSLSHCLINHYEFRLSHFLNTFYKKITPLRVNQLSNSDQYLPIKSFKALSPIPKEYQLDIRLINQISKSILLILTMWPLVISTTTNLTSNPLQIPSKKIYKYHFLLNYLQIILIFIVFSIF